MDTADNPLFWGLDPVFRTNAKMYIGDVMTMPNAEGFDSVFLYSGHAISKVDVMGVVVHADIRAKHSSYVLDDGTGTIFCTHWLNNDDKPQFDDVPEDLKQLVGKLSEPTEEYVIGTALHVRGKLRRYQGSTEISVSYVRKVTDPYEEINRMMELPVLYKKCYDIPPEVPENKPNDRKASAQKSFNRFLLEYLQKESTSSITENLLMSSAQLKVCFGEREQEIPDDSFDPLIKQALVDLTEEGMLYRYQENYIFVPLARKLEEEMLTILRQCTAEDGLRNRRLLQELKTRVEYSQLTLQALNRVLTNMESKSDVISVSENHYIAFG